MNVPISEDAAVILSNASILADFAYGSDDDLDALSNLFVEDTRPHRHDDGPFNSSFYSLTVNGTIYIVFRGTVFLSFKSWGGNLYAVKERMRGGAAHRGFSRIASSAAKTLSQSNITPMRHPMVFVGHSQGGAVALISALIAIMHKPLVRNVLVCTFGQPRALDPELCRFAELRFAERYFRVINRNDPVPGLPPTCFGFDHSRTYFHLNRTGKMRQKRQQALAGWLPKKPSIKDHSIGRYARKVSLFKRRMKKRGYSPAAA